MEDLKKGYEDYANGNFYLAHKNAIKVLRNKYNIDAYMLAGMSLHKLKRYEEADSFLEIAYKERKEVVAIQLYYLENLKTINEYNKAITELEKLQIIVPELVSLAVELYELNGNFTKAIELGCAIKDSVKKHEILAWNYEKLNNISRARQEALEGIETYKESFKLNLTLSKIYLRERQYKKAKKQLKRIRKQELSNVNLSIYNSVKAQCFEGLQKYKKAFRHYTKSNNCLKLTDRYKSLQGHSYYTFSKINIISNYFKGNPQFTNLLPSKENITFMVGYPRSGTTLLENMLNAHSQISTIEEKPLVDDILNCFLSDEDSINKLETISSTEIRELQKQYLIKRQKYCGKQNKIIIDKLPLNIIHIGILYRIFPNAKFIISTRDVRDVSLSCYFQNFAINDAMAYFLDWEHTRKYLDEIMSLGLMVINKYPIRNKIIKYEEFVEEPFAHIKELIKFLGLEWEDQLKDYRSKIQGKNINTPSYASITKKINSKRTKRWKNYKEFFN